MLKQQNNSAEIQESFETGVIHSADYLKITDFEHLYASMQKCRCSVLWKDSVASFYINGVERTLTLERELNNGTYRARTPKAFKIYSPKERDIVSISFRDRVYQRSLNDNYIYPVMTASFIHDNWACQKGKGTDGARNRLKEFMHSYYRKYGADGYVLKIDIKGYYPNMSHRVVEQMFRAKLEPSVYSLTEKILHEQYKGDMGYNPGSQLIQIAGIALLDKVDHYIKERLGVKYYLRYMDDFVLIHESKEYLEYCLCEIEKKLREVECAISPKKTYITTLKGGIMFLGFTYRLTDSGKVLAHIDPKNVKRERKKLAHAVAKAKRGELTREKVDEMYTAWKAHASKGNSYKLIQRMDEYYRNLWRS